MEVGSVFAGGGPAPYVVWQVTNGTIVGAALSAWAVVAGAADGAWLAEGLVAGECADRAGAVELGVVEHAASPTSATHVISAVSHDRRPVMSALLGTSPPI
jgi:hypothetical protein